MEYPLPDCLEEGHGLRRVAFSRDPHALTSAVSRTDSTAVQVFRVELAGQNLTKSSLAYKDLQTSNTCQQVLDSLESLGALGMAGGNRTLEPATLSQCFGPPDSWVEMTVGANA